MSPKSQHHRGNSKGTRSLFSGELWRIIRRTQSRSALPVSDERPDFSLHRTQCDPSYQASSYYNTHVEQDYTSSAQTSASTSLRTLYLRSIGKSSTTVPEEVSHYRKPRPLSWISLKRHKTGSPDLRSSSTQFAQPRSISSMARSRISTPILTSTTNARVADSENVEYSDVLLPDYSSRDIASLANGDEAVAAHHIHYSIVHPSTWSSTVRSMKKKLIHKRRASTSVLLETPWSRRMAEMKEHHDATIVHHTSPFRPVHTYREIFNRHRHGSTPSKIGSDGEDLLQGDLSGLVFTLRNKSTPDFRQPPRLPGLYSESNTDLLAPSLTKSFALAIDKLDFNSSPTLMGDSTPVSKLKKAKSYLSLHRLVRDYSERTLDKDEVVISSSPAIILSKDKKAQDSVDQSLSEADREDMYRPRIRASKPIQLRFSGHKKRYVPSQPDTNSPSGVNPLRMHPEVGSATKVSDQATPTTPKVPEDTDRRPSGSIERAILYSPSTGKLSVYSRTPSPSMQASAPRGRVPQDTPTRRPLRKVSGSMLRKSVSTLFGKSASMIKIANFTPAKRSQTERSIGAQSRHRTTSDTKLLDSRAVAEIRTRSLSTPEMHNSESARAPWDHQPSTPSPLRKSTIFDGNNINRKRAVTSTTPIRPSAGIMLDKARSNSVLSDPEKRYGRYIDQADAPGMAAC